MKAKIISYILCIAVVCSAVVLLTKTTGGADNGDYGTTESDGFEDTTVMDFSDLNKCVGAVDYVFVAVVDRQVGTSYREGDTYYDIGENPSDDSRASVYTLFSITVKENIKGSLKTGVSIPLYKNAGVDIRKNKLVLMQYDSMPEAGKEYLFLCNATSDGKLVVVAPVGNIFLYEQSRQGTIDAYINAYQNQTESEKSHGFLSSYDLSYGRMGKYSINSNKVF